MALATRDWALWSTAARLVTDARVLRDSAADVDALLEEIEQACSRFRPDSEVNQLHPVDGTVELSPVLADLVAHALEAYETSDGAVDPTLGRALAAIGYDRDIALVRARRSSARPSSRSVTLVRRRFNPLRLHGRTLEAPDDLLLDLGATAKAAAADRCANAIAERYGFPVLISLGGDLTTAGPEPDGGWQIEVRDLPTDPSVHVRLASGTAMATSSTVRRTWQHGGRPMHHIIDPRTKRSARGPWRTVSVVAPRCTLANTAATGAIVKGAAAPEWLARLGLPARLVDHDGQVLTLNGWPR